MSDTPISTCPTCGSTQIRRVKRDIESKRGPAPYTARGIEVDECPACGERIFGPEALAAIAAQKPGRQPEQKRSA